MENKMKCHYIKIPIGDYLADTVTFDLKQKGAYMDLLILQHTTGRFDIEQAQKILGSSFEKVWPVLKQNYETDGENYWSKKHEQSIERQIKYHQSRRDNALAGRQIVLPVETLSDAPTIVDGSFLTGAMLNEYMRHNRTYPKSPAEDYPALLGFAQFIAEQCNIPLDFSKENNDKILVRWNAIAKTIVGNENWKNKSLRTLAKFNKQEIFGKISPLRKIKAFRIDDEGWVIYEDGSRVRADHHDYKAFLRGGLKLDHFDKSAV